MTDATTTAAAPSRAIEIATYDDLIAVMRERRIELEMPHEVLDDIAGWTNTYSTKLLGHAGSKHLGHMTFALALQALALRLFVVPDDEAAARLRRRYTPRRPDRDTYGRRQPIAGSLRRAEAHPRR